MRSAGRVIPDAGMRSSVSILPGSLFLIVILALTGPAQAYEDETGVALGFGYTGAPVAAPSHGPIFEATVDTGLSPTWSLRVQGAYARMRPKDTRAHLLRTGLEAVYIVDVVDWVPSVGGGADLVGWIQDGSLQLGPSLHATIGLDYLLSRVWTLGLNLRIFAGPTVLLDPATALNATLSVRYVLSD